MVALAREIDQDGGREGRGSNEFKHDRAIDHRGGPAAAACVSIKFNRNCTPGKEGYLARRKRERPVPVN